MYMSLIPHYIQANCSESSEYMFNNMKMRSNVFISLYNTHTCRRLAFLLGEDTSSQATTTTTEDVHYSSNKEVDSKKKAKN